MRYNLWALALRVGGDVTEHGRHIGRHLGFYQQLKMSLKNETCQFCAIVMKDNT